MDHEEAVRLMATEKYLLGDLALEKKEEFEEHFFGCPDCANDVRAGAAFVEHSKSVLSAGVPQAAPAGQTQQKGWLAWLRPAFAVPVMAVLLLVVGYQSLIVVPGLKVAGNRPQVLPAVSLISSATRGGSIPTLRIREGEAFLLFVDVPANARFASYSGDLYSPGGEREWSVAISAEAAHDTLPIRVPAGLKTPGHYRLSVRGIAGDGSSSEIGNYPFELQLQ